MIFTDIEGMEREGIRRRSLCSQSPSVLISQGVHTGVKFHSRGDARYLRAGSTDVALVAQNDGKLNTPWWTAGEDGIPLFPTYIRNGRFVNVLDYIIIVGHKRDNMIVEVPTVNDGKLDYDAITRFSSYEDTKVFVKCCDVTWRKRDGWVNILNLVPAGLSHSESYVEVKHRKESPALPTADLTKFLSLWGLYDVMGDTRFSKPITHELGFALAERFSATVLMAKEPLQGMLDLVKRMEASRMVEHPALKIPTAYEQNFAANRRQILIH